MGRKKSSRFESEPSSSPGDLTFSRRQLFRRGRNALAEGLVIALVLQTPKKIVQAVTSAAINARYPIPDDLQQPTDVPAGVQTTAHGAGDSFMEGTQKRGIAKPLVSRVAEQATSRGFPMNADSQARNGSTTADLPNQFARMQADPQARNEAHISVGGNDIAQDETMQSILREFENHPSLATVGNYRQRKEELKKKISSNIVDAVEHNKGELGQDGITFYGTPPVQYAPEIDQLQSNGSVKTYAIASGPDPQRTVRQILAADLGRLGTESNVVAAQRLKERGQENVTVIDTASVVGPGDFPGDQHPSPEAAADVADLRARKYRRKSNPR